MTNYGFCFHPVLGRDDCSGFLHFWAEHRGTTRLTPTGYDVRYEEWDPVFGRLVIPEDDSKRKRRLVRYAESMTHDLECMNTVVMYLRSTGYYTANEVIRHYSLITPTGSVLLGDYAGRLASEMERQGHKRAAKSYITATKRLIGFHNGRDIDMKHITADLMNDFQCRLQADGASMNTVSFHMRALRAIYNKAVTDGLVPQRMEHPFDGVYTDVVLTGSCKNENNDSDGEDFVDFIRDHASDGLTVTELARLYGCCTDKFYMLFWKHFSDTPGRWFRKQMKAEETACINRQ